MARTIIAVAMLLAWSSSVVPATAGALNNRLAPPSCAWHLIPSQSTSNDGNELDSVFALSATDAWSVGEHSDNFSGDYWPLIEHWDGTAWTIVNSPQPLNTYVSSVREIAASDVWAVGGSQNQSTFADQTFIEHWNGSSWSVVPSPNVGTASNDLVALAYSSSTDVWAFGYYFSTTAAQYLTLTEHWNGSTWSVV